MRLFRTGSPLKTSFLQKIRGLKETPKTLYQLDLTTPGMSPMFAISRKHKRESLNFLKNPLERPVIWQRLRKRTGEEFLGSLFKALIASERSSSLLEKSDTTFFSCCLLSHFRDTIFSLFFCLAIEDFLAIKLLSLVTFCELDLFVFACDLDRFY